VISLFNIEQGLVSCIAAAPVSFELIAAARWVDVQSPDEQELALVQQLLQTKLPGSGDIAEIEPSSRCYTDADGIHLHSLFLGAESPRRATSSVVCILQAARLITLRDCELADFRLLHGRAGLGQLESRNTAELLLTVLDMKVDTLADHLEDIHRQLEHTSYLVLRQKSPWLAEAIDKLATAEDLNGKIDLCLMDTKRDVSFLLKHMRSMPDQQEFCGEIMQDIDTLMAHNIFLADKIKFLMESTQGFISIEQNQIIKTLSVAAVVFLPPTLVASIYGMNFLHLPELAWQLGYPWALGLMLASAALPLWYFKRKGWL
jgi:magnesium transporter